MFLFSGGRQNESERIKCRCYAFGWFYLFLCPSPPISRRNDLLSTGFDVSRMEWVRQLSENISPRFHSIWFYSPAIHPSPVLVRFPNPLVHCCISFEIWIIQRSSSWAINYQPTCFWTFKSGGDLVSPHHQRQKPQTQWTAILFNNYHRAVVPRCNATYVHWVFFWHL